MTALTWAPTGKFRGELVGNATAVFVSQNIREKETVSKEIHIAAEDIWRAEELYIKDTQLKKARTVELNGDMVIRLSNHLSRYSPG